MRGLSLLLLLATVCAPQRPIRGPASRSADRVPRPWAYFDLWRFGEAGWFAGAEVRDREVAVEERSICASGNGVWVLLAKGGRAGRALAEHLVLLSGQPLSIRGDWAVAEDLVPAGLECSGPYLVGPSSVAGPIGPSGPSLAVRTPYPGGPRAYATMGADHVLGIIVARGDADVIEAVRLGQARPLALARCPHPACGPCLFPTVDAQRRLVLAECGPGADPSALVAQVSYGRGGSPSGWRPEFGAEPQPCGDVTSIAYHPLRQIAVLYGAGHQELQWLHAPDGYQFGPTGCAGNRVLLAVLARTGNGFFSFSDAFHVRSTELAAYPAAPAASRPAWVIKAPTGMAFEIAADIQSKTIYLLDPHGDLYYAPMPNPAPTKPHRQQEGKGATTPTLPG